MRELCLLDGKYKILEILGKGGMGTVYLAENIRLGTLWAVKEIPKDPDTQLNTLTESNILRKLNHPALPRIIDIVENDQYVYIVVDYIEGVSLEQELKIAGKFSEEKILDWAKQICHVLRYLHTLEPYPVIYRDMKPSNIMLTPDGTIKLIDFGIAREYKSGLDNDTVYIGTKGYAAPEQYGGGQTDVTSDIYSLGVTLYHLLTGHNPNQPPYEIKPVRHFDRELSRDIERVIERCTRLNPSERYQSADELLADLKGVGKNFTAENICPYNEDETTPSGIIKEAGSFKSLILTVWNNSEFACELAYVAAKQTDLSILIINLDFISPNTNGYFNMLSSLYDPMEQNIEFESLIDESQKSTLTPRHFKETAFKIINNLYLLTGGYFASNYENFRDKNFQNLIENAYRCFDITIVNVYGYPVDIYILTALQHSHHNIMAVRPDLVTINEYNNYIRMLKDKYNMPYDKQKFVAYEYKKGIHMPLEKAKKYWGRCHLGLVSYMPQRERYRNLKAVYAKRLYDENINEYLDILSKLGVTPKRKLIQRIESHFKIKKRKAKNESM